MASVGKSAREVQEEIERALRRRRARTRLRLLGIVRRAFFVMFVPALLVGLLWVALVGLHFSKGAGLGDSISMTVDDARVAASCPSKPRGILDFLRRSETVPMAKVMSPQQRAREVQLVCNGAS